jgi:hypothetical protein
MRRFDAGSPADHPVDLEDVREHASIGESRDEDRRSPGEWMLIQARIIGLDPRRAVPAVVRQRRPDPHLQCLLSGSP